MSCPAARTSSKLTATHSIILSQNESPAPSSAVAAAVAPPSPSRFRNLPQNTTPSILTKQELPSQQNYDALSYSICTFFV
mmetsp:Transcript_64506/g.76384  ORF Transcript_64506/g.76384 Transcript_64506/m.76384 type:complete len:80 (-) Transcript_64506:15-254(-)